MGMYGGGDYGAGEARAEEQARQLRIAQGKDALDLQFGQFDDAFYKERAQAESDWAMPQFADQFTEAKNSLVAALARRGLLRSGAAVQAKASLDKYADTKRREIAGNIQNNTNNLRRDVADQKSALVSQLQATADNTAALNEAVSRTAAIRQPTGFGSLGQMFADWTDAYRANQVARAEDNTIQPLFSFAGNRRSASSIVG